MGDANTKFFHNSVKQRVCKNTISSLKDEMGNRITDPELIGEAMVDFYKKLLGSEGRNRKYIDMERSGILVREEGCETNPGEANYRSRSVGSFVLHW